MLVAQGLTNRQIAEALVITERTAETHLERIYSKLELHSRAQLATWATEHQLSGTRGLINAQLRTRFGETPDTHPRQLA